MKIIGFNGSPRKNWYTAIVLKKAEFPNDCKKAFEMGVRFARQDNICK